MKEKKYHSRVEGLDYLRKEAIDDLYEKREEILRHYYSCADPNSQKGKSLKREMEKIENQLETLGGYSQPRYASVNLNPTHGIELRYVGYSNPDNRRGKFERGWTNVEMRNGSIVSDARLNVGQEFHIGIKKPDKEENELYVVRIDGLKDGTALITTYGVDNVGKHARSRTRKYRIGDRILKI